MATILTTRKTLSLAFIATGLGIGLIAGCEAGKKAEKKSPPPKPPELTVYTPKKDGEWLIVDNVERYKENASLQFKRFGGWIGASWFRIATMRRDGIFTRSANTVLNAIDYEEGVNPSIGYSCLGKDFYINFGSAMEAITNGNRETSHYIFRFDGAKHYAEQNLQQEPRKLKGVNPATGEFQKAPKGIPETYTGKKNPWWDLFENSKTIEISVIDKPKDTKQGIYAKWVLQKTLKEQKASGELDRACKALIGVDYITVAMVEQQAKEEKKVEAQDQKQKEADSKKQDEKQ